MSANFSKGALLALMVALFLLPSEAVTAVRGLPEGKPRLGVGDRAYLEREELKTAHEEGKTILLMFGNPWHCIYCERTWFNIREILRRYEKEVAFVLVEAQPVKFWRPEEENLELARRYGVIGEPWVFLIDREGVVRHVFVGFRPKREIEAVLSQVVAP